MSEPARNANEARLAAYGRLLGHATGKAEGPAGVDVLQVPPGFHGRDFWTLVTSGLSDHRMAVPGDLGPEHARAELVLYVPEPTPSHVRLLQTCAALATEPETWLGHGHSIPNGQPPAPLFPGSELKALLLLRTILEPDAFLPDHLTIEGDPVNFLWLVPITAAELDLKLVQGLPALLQRFDEGGLSHLLD
jgi:hypothetical protein